MRFKTALVLACAALAAGCAQSLMEEGEYDPDRYKTAVAQAQEAGHTAYWLGPRFEVGGAVFDAIEGYYPQGAAGISVDGVELVYYNLEDSRGDLSITTLDQDDWATVEEHVRNPKQPPRKTKVVTVAGKDAYLISTQLFGRDPNGLKLLIDYGDSFVIAYTGAAVSEAGANLNPLLDEETFLALLEGLRPYPQ